jgi:hypothetical protein
LQQGRSIGSREAGTPPSLIADYNAETNVITAEICHADGLRPVIRGVLRHIR